MIRSNIYGRETGRIYNTAVTGVAGVTTLSITGIKIIMMYACYDNILPSLSPLQGTSNVVTTNIPLCYVATIVTPITSA